MPEIKNTFLKAKMNKSLDDRLLPEGEYRDALNVQVTKNDGNGSDVGVIHNVKGNSLAYENSLNLDGDFQTIGHFFDDQENKVYWFVTDNTSHYIYQWTPGSAPVAIVSDATNQFLNFNKSNLITGVNILEGFLFWTDNRNQPRRIDIAIAENNTSYYNSEEKISVAKYAPYLPPSISMSYTSAIHSRQIEQKFVRFAYRFKFEDNTYSLISPFSNVAFQPKDSIINNSANVSIDNENDIFGTSEVKGMVNGINQVDLSIDVPSNLEIKEIDILYKETDSPAVRIVDTKNISDVSNSTLTYSYKSTQPKLTLAENQVTRVFDNVPVKALAQEIVSNRLVYGNITLGYNVDNDICDYEVDYSPKETTSFATQSVKQRRSYQIGIVFSDKFGRTSPVFLSNTSTIYVEPKDENFDNTNFDGDSLKIIFKPVQENGSSVAVKNAYSASNQFGWYSYKIVIKQQEQEYYNVYTSGILDYNNGYIELINDNINKVPRDTSNYNLDNQEIATSDVRLYPKVLNSSSSNNNGGDFAKSTNSDTDLISVLAIANPLELNLKTETTSVITGMYNAADNPLMAKLDIKNVGELPASFRPKIAVFETEPTVSSLDIFYETPTCGLVSELNDNINLYSLTAISFNEAYAGDATDTSAGFSEASRLNGYVATLYGFYDDTNNNNAKTLLDSGVTYALTDSSGNLPGSQNYVVGNAGDIDKFEIYLDLSDNKYKIRTTDTFVYDANDFAKTVYVVATFANVSLSAVQLTLNVENANPTVVIDQESITMPTDQDEDVNVQLATFTVTDGSFGGSSGVTGVTISEEHFEADGTPEGTHPNLFGVSYTAGQQTGYVYLNNDQHLHNHVTGDYIVVTLTATDGTNTGQDTVTVNLTTSGVTGSEPGGGSAIKYYQASWNAFSNTSEACNTSVLITSVWTEIYIYYEGNNQPMDLTSPGTLYTDINLSVLAPAGWYKSTAGSVGKWNGSSWSILPTSCTQ